MDTLSPTPENFALMMQNLGYQALVDRTTDDQPVIRSGVSGLRFSVYMLDPVKERQNHYAAVQLYMGLNPGEDPDLDAINQLNATWRFSKIYLDSDRDIVLELDFALGSVLNGPAIERSFAAWAQFVGAVLVKIDWYK